MKEMLQEFFMWMTILNVGLLIFSTLICLSIKETIGRMHGRLFGVTPDAIKITLYGFLGAYKIFFIVFCLTPWLALKFMQ